MNENEYLEKEARDAMARGGPRPTPGPPLSDGYRALEEEGMEAAHEAMERARHEPPDSARRAQDAVDEKGEIVVEVWCDRCGDGAAAIAIVRRYSKGFVFDGRGEQFPVSADEAAKKIEEAHERGQRLPPFVLDEHERVQVLLTEAPTADSDWPPSATCSIHGSTVVSPRDLLLEARSARLGRPRKMSVHPSK